MKTYQINLTYTEIDIILNALKNDEKRHQKFLDEVIADIMKEVNFDESKFEKQKLDNEFFKAANRNIEAHKSAKHKFFHLQDKYWEENNEN